MIKALSVSILFILVIAFVFQNQEIFLHEFLIAYDIKISSFDNKSVSNSLLLAGSFLLGVVICLVSIGLSSISKSVKINELKKKINTLEKAALSKEVK